LALEANGIPVNRDRGLCVHGKGRGSRRIELLSIDAKQDVATPDLSSLGDPAGKHVLKNPPLAYIASLNPPKTGVDASGSIRRAAEWLTCGHTTA
jgi:hypothetical protein